MKVNKELMEVMRRGEWIDSHEVKKQNDSGVIAGVCIILAMFIVFIASLVGATEMPELCGCTRESKDSVCKAYYELKDAGLDVKVVCREKGDHEWKIAMK